MPEFHDLETGSGRPVLVGLDGSDHAAAAVAWAAEEALRRAVPLRLAIVVEAEHGTALTGADSADTAWDEAVEEALNLLATTETALRVVHPELVIQREVTAGDPVHELRTAAKHCALLVIGSRGRGGFAGLALGSVSLHLAASAQHPLVVVPQGHAAVSHQGPTVVGVGDRECPAVLRYALEHAARTDGKLRAVHAWLPYPAHSAQYVSDTDITARHAAEKTAAWLKDVRAEDYGSSPEIRVLRGRPGDVLVEQSADADLLVLGAHRRHVPLSGAIGPVLHHTLVHAHCPVALIPMN